MPLHRTRRVRHEAVGFVRCIARRGQVPSVHTTTRRDAKTYNEKRKCLNWALFHSEVMTVAMIESDEPHAPLRRGSSMGRTSSVRRCKLEPSLKALRFQTLILKKG